MTNLYDQYKIDYIDCYFVPLNQPVIATTTSQGSGILFTAVDYDDTGTPASLAVVLNYANVKMHPAGQAHTLSFKPHVAVSAYSGGAFGAFGNQASQWIDAASMSVTHFGVKYAITGSANWPVWRMICRYHLSFKSSR